MEDVCNSANKSRSVEEIWGWIQHIRIHVYTQHLWHTQDLSTTYSTIYTNTHKYQGIQNEFIFSIFFFEIKTFFLLPYGSNSFWLSQMVYLCLAYIKMCTSPTRLPDRMRRYSQKTDYKKGEKQKLDSDCRM